VSPKKKLFEFRRLQAAGRAGGNERERPRPSEDGATATAAVFAAVVFAPQQLGRDNLAPAAQRDRAESGEACEHHRPDRGFGDQSRRISVDKRVNRVRAR
jgi:hypothetical protein